MSNIIKVQNLLIRKGLRASSPSCNAGKIFAITGVLKFPNCESSCLSRCQYSTLMYSRRLQLKDYASISIPTLNFASCLSTGSNEEKFKVVITNPADNTTSTSEFSLKPPDAISSNTFSTNETMMNSAQTDLTPSEVLSSNISSGSEVIADSATEITDIATNITSFVPITQIAEPSLASLGLCHWTPVGLLQQWLEYLHVSMNMPWWMTIVTSTVIARILLIPLLIKTQKNAIEMANYMPKLQYLQTKFGEARRAGNPVEATRYASEIMLFVKENNIKPWKNAMMPLLQAPVFLSFFMGLRAMAKLPVYSMKYGGLYWTMDLTIPDPYYVLPLVACSTLYVVLKVGAESGVKMDTMKLAKYFLRAIPVIALPFCINFPSAVLYYWCTNNFCTLLIVSVMKIEPVRKFLKMPIQQPPDPKFVAEKKGFIQSVKDSIEDQKVLAAVEDRQRIDTVSFQKAGIGPIPRTYAYDPTKPRPARAAAAAGIKSKAKMT